MTRRCGDCQLCCTLLPTREVPTAAGERCKHQRFHKGCAIYKDRPTSCRLWSCRWLTEDDTADLRRPDRSGYVLDMLPDFITLEQPDRPIRIEVVQVWVDPRRPDSHRDPALRAWLERRAEDGVAALVRLSGKDGFVLFAPAFTSGRGWVERTGNCEPEHPMADVMKALWQRDSVRVPDGDRQ
jgi:hypothetical protein